MVRYKILIAFIIIGSCIVFQITGCKNFGDGKEKDGIVSESASFQEGEKTLEADVKLLIDETEIDLDCAEGIVERLRKVGASELIEVELLSQKRGYHVRVIDTEKRIYHLGLGRMGYLECIRKDSEDGEILYGALDD